MAPFQKGKFSRSIKWLPATVASTSASGSALPTDADCATQVIGNIGCLPFFLKNIVNAGFIFAAGVAVILIILSGIRLVVSGGDEIKVAQAKKSLTYTIIGLVIILLAFALINLIGRITGAQL